MIIDHASLLLLSRVLSDCCTSVKCSDNAARSVCGGYNRFIAKNVLTLKLARYNYWRQSGISLTL